MSQATERFATALGKHLSASEGWQQTTSNLLPDLGEIPAFVCETRAAVLIVPGDGTTPVAFRSIMEGLQKKAKTPPSPKQPVNPVPWSAVFVILVFEDEISSDLRTFIQNDRRPITPQRFLQGGWAAVSSGEANFRTNKTPLETEMLSAAQQAAVDVAEGNLAPPPARAGKAAGGAAPKGKASLDLMGGEPSGETPKRKKKGGCGFLIFGLLLIIVGGAAFAYLQYPDLVKQYVPQLFDRAPPTAAPSVAPSAAPSGAAKVPAPAKSGAPVKAPEAGKSGAPAKSPEASTSGAPASPAPGKSGSPGKNG